MTRIREEEVGPILGLLCKFEPFTTIDIVHIRPNIHEACNYNKWHEAANQRSCSASVSAIIAATVAATVALYSSCKTDLDGCSCYGCSCYGKFCCRYVSRGLCHCCRCSSLSLTLSSLPVEFVEDDLAQSANLLVTQ